MAQSEEQADRSTPKHKLDTPDFLAFSDSPQSEFCPTESSSPQKPWKQTHKNNFRNNYRFSGNYRNNSYGSPDSPHSRSFSGSYENKYSKQCESPNRSFGSSFNNSRSSFTSSFDTSGPRNNRSFNNSMNRRNDRTGGVEDYVHPSFMEDPWAALEKRLLKAVEDQTIEPDMLGELSPCPENDIIAET